MNRFEFLVILSFDMFKASWVFPILNSSAMDLQPSFLFFISSNILIFSS